MTHLRHITVFVDEPDPAHFHWVLHESTMMPRSGSTSQRARSLIPLGPRPSKRASWNSTDWSRTKSSGRARLDL